MDQSTVAALGVAAIITPWLVEIIKKFIGNPEGKKALVLSMVVSVLVAAGVLGYEGKLAWGNPSAIFASAALVLGVANAVYQFVQGAVKRPIDTVKGFLIK